MAEANEIPSLWPVEIARTTVRSPVMILRIQAAELTRLTAGVVRGEVVYTELEDERDDVAVSLDVVAPATQNLRRRLLTIQHNRDGAYPVFISGGGGGAWLASEENFIDDLSKRLGSSECISAVQTLIARSNQAFSDNEPQTA